jgi:hypothetical protein
MSTALISSPIEAVDSPQEEDGRAVEGSDNLGGITPAAVDLSRLEPWAAGRGDAGRGGPHRRAAVIFTQPLRRAADNVGIMSPASALASRAVGPAEDG